MFRTLSGPPYGPSAQLTRMNTGDSTNHPTQSSYNRRAFFATTCADSSTAGRQVFGRRIDSQCSQQFLSILLLDDGGGLVAE